MLTSHWQISSVMKKNARADSMFAPWQWETSLQSNAVSHWLGANIESPCTTHAVWFQSVCAMAVHRQRAAWRSTMRVSGAQCVISGGTTMMPSWCVYNSASQVEARPPGFARSHRAQEKSGWLPCIARNILLDGVIKWKYFPPYWSFVRDITGHRWIPPQKASDTELWCFFLRAWTNGWANNLGAGDLRRHRTHYDVTVML